MASCQLNTVLDHLRRACLVRDASGMTDGQLLERFLARQDETALEVLVWRHGPMAWGVCRRVLRDYHDAEDAFQATFLVLVRRAASITPRELVGNWLYGVAYRTALKVRATVNRRNVRERQVTAMPEPEAPPPERWQDWQRLLDKELSRLPDNYRVPIILCDLEGRTRKEVARQLGWPEGTVAGRLARGRKLLAQSLFRRGVVLSGGALAVELARNAAGAPAALVSSTIRAARLCAAGKAAAGATSVRVAALTEGVLQTMGPSKTKTALVLFVIVLLGLGGGALAWPGHAAEEGLPPQRAAAETPAKKRDEDNLKNTLLALDQHLWEAASRGDSREYGKFIAAEYLGVESVNKCDHRANVEAVKYYRPADWKLRDVEVVRVSNDAAVLTYVYSCKVLSPDGRLLQTRVNHRATLVWGLRNGGWVCIYCHDEHNRQPGPAAAVQGGHSETKVDVLRRAERAKAKPGADPGK